MHRLFAALRPPAAIRAVLLDTMGGVPHARWQDDDQLHVTLHFIGEVETPQAEDVAAALAGVSAPAMMARIAGVGSFDHSLWAGVAPHDPLVALHRKIVQALARVGIAPDRRAYLPHITLARMPRSAGNSAAVTRWIADHAALASETFPLDRLILYESSLGGEGARYHVIAAWPLG